MSPKAPRNPLISAGLVLATYWIWLSAFHLVGMAVVTYGMLGATPGVREIADQYYSNAWTIQGWGSLLFFLAAWGLSVADPGPWSEMSRSSWKTHFLPPFLRAAGASTAWILLLMAATPFQYLGAGFSWSEAPWSALTWLTRCVGWFGWAIGDEAVFRKLLLSRLRRWFSSRGDETPWVRHGDLLSVLVVTALGVLTRAFGQNLGLSQTLTLTLLGLVLGFRVCSGRHYLGGAAMLAASALVFQGLFSLPLLGQEQTGLWLLKFSPASSPSFSPFPELMRFASGGAGGPASSGILQLFLLGALARILWTLRGGSLR